MTPDARRVPITVVALGGNAIAPGTDPAGTAPSCQIARIAQTSRALAAAVADGERLVITHGNGPQVGNLLTKNELAANVVPAVPLDWCVAQTQATIGVELAAAMERELRRLGKDMTVVPLLTRILVDEHDPAFETPTKPIGRYLHQEQAPTGELPPNHAWSEQSDQQWRRVVPSPKPLRIVDGNAVDAVHAASGLVIACGGGGIPVIAAETGYVGVEAVVDKDLAAVVLARHVGAHRLVVLTDVEGAAIDYGTPAARLLTGVTPAELRGHLDAEQFGVGTMETKVTAVVEFVEATGGSAAIGSLDDARSVMAGTSGTQVVAAPSR